MQQTLCKKRFLTHEAGAFINNIEKTPQKPFQNLRKHACYIFIDNICSVCNLMQVVIFCKNVLILWNNDSDFLTLIVA